jgi:lipopolysaccharide biosynthesis protein
MVLALRQSDIDWRLIFTTSPEREQALRKRLQYLGVAEEVYVFENRGRDILPFLQVADRLLEEGVDVVLKLHTKRSTHREDGDQWRKELIEKLISPERAKSILEAFQVDPRLGLAAAEGHLQPLNNYLGANEANIRYLMTRLGMATRSLENDHFIAGSMFWARLEVFRPILNAHIGLWEFEEESGQLDGTLAHAVERVITLSGKAGEYSVVDIATLCGLPLASDAREPYRYARRSN